MATTTDNLGMTLPAGTDRAEISVLNENFQTLDTFAGQQAGRTASLIDAGAKNKLANTAYTQTVDGVTYTVNADRSITITSDGTNTQSKLYLTQNAPLPAGDYILSGCTGGSSTAYDLRVTVGDTVTHNYDDGTPFTADGSPIEVSIVVMAAQTLNITIYPMICTADDYAASTDYVPYVPTMLELYQMIQALQTGGVE